MQGMPRTGWTADGPSASCAANTTTALSQLTVDPPEDRYDNSHISVIGPWCTRRRRKSAQGKGNKKRAGTEWFTAVVPFGSHPLSFPSQHTHRYCTAYLCTKTRLSVPEQSHTSHVDYTSRDHDSRVGTRLQLHSDTRQVGHESWLPTKETEECSTSVSTRTRTTTTCDTNKNNNNKYTTAPTQRHDAIPSVRVA
jgi:hypothetical protein